MPALKGEGDAVPFVLTDANRAVRDASITHARPSGATVRSATPLENIARRVVVVTAPAAESATWVATAVGSQYSSAPAAWMEPSGATTRCWRWPEGWLVGAKVLVSMSTAPPTEGSATHMRPAPAAMSNGWFIPTVEVNTELWASVAASMTSTRPLPWSATHKRPSGLAAMPRGSTRAGTATTDIAPVAGSTRPSVPLAAPVTHNMASGPTARSSGSSRPVAGNEVTAPVVGLTRPTVSLSAPVTHRLPSGPLTMLRGPRTPPESNTTRVPVFASRRAMVSLSSPAIHTPPSVVTTTPAGPSTPSSSRNTGPAAVTRAMVSVFWPVTHRALAPTVTPPTSCTLLSTGMTCTAGGATVAAAVGAVTVAMASLATSVIAATTLGHRWCGQHRSAMSSLSLPSRPCAEMLATWGPGLAARVSR